MLVHLPICGGTYETYLRSVSLVCSALHYQATPSSQTFAQKPCAYPAHARCTLCRASPIALQHPQYCSCCTNVL